MVACLSVAIPIWIHNGYKFWVPRMNCTGNAGNDQIPRTKEVSPAYYKGVFSFMSSGCLLALSSDRSVCIFNARYEFCT